MAPTTLPTGYLSAEYARSLAEFGTPRHLPESDGWILERAIPGGSARDAMGCYPLFACRDWSQLAADLGEIGDLVSLVLVADPLGNFSADDLRRCFPDLVAPFKEHHVVDLTQAPRSFVDPHHQRNARKGLQALTIDRALDPARLVGEWSALYANLIERHGIRGISIFSPQSFAQQLQVPGITMFCARLEEEIVGMNLWYAGDDAGYYHLGAYSDRGYELRASFALFWQALEYFAAAGITRLDLGAGAGLNTGESDGLTRFKRGWATGTRPAYLCGRIFDPQQYATLASARQLGQTLYFPAYRSGEFT